MITTNWTCFEVWNNNTKQQGLLWVMANQFASQTDAFSGNGEMGSNGRCLKRRSSPGRAAVTSTICLVLVPGCNLAIPRGAPHSVADASMRLRLWSRWRGIVFFLKPNNGFYTCLKTKRACCITKCFCLWNRTMAVKTCGYTFLLYTMFVWLPLYKTKKTKHCLWLHWLSKYESFRFDKTVE